LRRKGHRPSLGNTPILHTNDRLDSLARNMRSLRPLSSFMWHGQPWSIQLFFSFRRGSKFSSSVGGPNTTSCGLSDVQPVVQDCGRARTGRGLDLGLVLEISSSRYRIAGGLALVADSIWASGFWSSRRNERRRSASEGEAQPLLLFAPTSATIYDDEEARTPSVGPHA
jgi:hypothetical protein